MESRRKKIKILHTLRAIQSGCGKPGEVVIANCEGCRNLMYDMRAAIGNQAKMNELLRRGRQHYGVDITCYED